MRESRLQVNNAQIFVHLQAIKPRLKVMKRGIRRMSSSMVLYLSSRHGTNKLDKISRGYPLCPFDESHACYPKAGGPGEGNGHRVARKVKVFTSHQWLRRISR